MRREFPDAYLKSFGYYDRDIIYYQIAHQDLEGIEDSLRRFKEYPDHDADNLFSLIDFLRATACDPPLIGLLEATYDPICRSKRVIGGDAIRALDPVLLRALSGRRLEPPDRPLGSAPSGDTASP